MVGDSCLLRRNLHSSDLCLAFTSSPVTFPPPRIAFTGPRIALTGTRIAFTWTRIAFTDPFVTFSSPLHSACSSLAALTHLRGSVKLFEAFISFLWIKASARLARSWTRSKISCALSLLTKTVLKKEFFPSTLFEQPAVFAYLPVPRNCSSNNLASFSSLLYLLQE